MILKHPIICKTLSYNYRRYQYVGLILLESGIISLINFHMLKKLKEDHIYFEPSLIEL